MKAFLIFIVFIKISLIHGQNATIIDPKLLQIDQEEKVKVVVIMKEQWDNKALQKIKGKDAKAKMAYDSLLILAEKSQKNIQAYLIENDIKFRSFYIVNMIGLEANKQLIQSISLRKDVKSIVKDDNFEMIQPVDRSFESNGNRAIEWNISKINAPQVWNLGYKGQNVVIGGQDTGYKWDHNALKNKYRGWDGTLSDHDYNWHDAIYGAHPLNSGTNPCGYNLDTPCDDNNHGTHTMGTMIGDDGGGNQIGVAPDSKWIGCRNMERGYGTLTSYVECFEWFLAPYPYNGNPNDGDPSKMPHVINNSWGCPTEEGCNPSNIDIMEDALENLRSAGCVIVVSAGNSGNACGTVSDPPAFFKGSFSVGATNNSDVIANFSSRGAVTIDGSNRLKPNISAPGVNVRSSIANGSYASFNGTSMAGPHVAGLVALLISANPNLAGEVDKIENIIERTALNLTSTQTCNGITGSMIPNNTYGYGRVDALAAINMALNELYVPFIKVDAFGYRDGDQKIAILSDPMIGYNSADSYTPSSTIHVKDASTHQIIFSGSPISWQNGNVHDQSGDKVWRFDFSNVTTPGQFYISDGNDGSIRSEDFNIQKTVYHDVIKTAFKTFFYQRAAQIKSEPYVMQGYQDDASHLQDTLCRFILDPNNPARYKNLKGGWYDAGDYNKYVNFTHSALIDLLLSYEINPEAWASDNLGIPESNNNIPDLLDEIKYELDWILRMQDNTDGGMYCIVGTQNFESASPPSADNAIRYYGPKTTSASFTAASSLALAAYQFKKINNSQAQEYAVLLQSAAINAYNWAISNPNITYYNTNNLGAGEQELDSYERSMRKLCAEIYLYALTNNSTYKNAVESSYTQSHLLQWTYVYAFESTTQQSLLFYAHLSGTNASVCNAIKNAFRNSINNNSENYPSYINDTDAYLAYLKNADIGWGSNGYKCKMANQYQLYKHYNLDSSKNTNLSRIMANFIHYIHGVNPNGLCYLTNMSSYGSDNSINAIYHSWFNNESELWDDVRTSTYGPPPGFLSGGPNPSWTLDSCCPNGCGSPSNNSQCIDLTPPSNQPILKSYKDWNTAWPQNSWSITENGIYYQASYLFLLSAFVDQTINQPTTTKVIISNADLMINNISTKLILTSENGTTYALQVDNNGVLTTNIFSETISNENKIYDSDLLIQQYDKGLVLQSPNFSYWRIQINNSGSLSSSSLGSLPTVNVSNQNNHLRIVNNTNGVIFSDMDNHCYLLTVNNYGNLFTRPVVCQN